MSANPKTTPKDAWGYDAMSTYLPLDSLGINALPDSEKYKRGIKENRTGRTRTLGIWFSCADCGLNQKFQNFIPNDHGIDLSEEIEMKVCPDPECKNKNFSVFMADKYTVFYPSNTPCERRQGKYRVLTIDGKCSCGSKQGYDKEEWHSKSEDNVTWTPKNHMQPCPDCGNKYWIDWTEEERTYL